MGFIERIISWFRPREQVNLLKSIPGDLRIVSAAGSDPRIIPGMTRTAFSAHTVKSRGLTYFNGQNSSPDWVPAQYDHSEIETLYDVESYFARATRAKLYLFLKEGYDFVGTNDERVEYIRARIRQIERATSVPFRTLLLDTCRDLLVHSNAFWLKIRKTEASGGSDRKVGSRIIKPVAGYFRLPPETMIAQIDSSGNIIGWKQSILGEEKIFRTEDIQHFYTNKKSGYHLGVPSIVPVIDDIRALRSIEHNIDILIHKHLFPIILWKVGTENRPAQLYSTGESEIDVVKDAVANMPTEGSLVVSERYNVSAIGVENKALRVDSYIEHFKQRVFAGLDVSSIDMAEGTASSRSTAQTLSRNLIDAVKMHQIIIEEFITHVIEELLLESTFPDETILDKENIVRLKFHEIDKESKQSEENHLMDLFLKNGVSYPEFRIGIGREVLTEEEEKELWWNKFGREDALIGSVDELSGSGASDPLANNVITNKNQPTNQHQQRPSAKLNKDSYLESKDADKNPVLFWHRTIGAEIQARFANNTLKWPLAGADIATAYETAISEFLPIIRKRIQANYFDPFGVHVLVRQTENKIRKVITKLRDELVERLKRGEASPNVIFASFEYRAIVIFDTELAFAENLSTLRWLQENERQSRIVSDSDSCNLCESKLTVIRWNDKLGEANIPPFHPLCRCKVVDAGRQA
jgi:hypothetical protein